MSDVERLTAALSKRYVIQREVGQGGMATVYLARDIKHDRNVAVKALHPDLAAVVGAERFLQEIKVTASLQHPHILPLHDSGEADDLLYYVMPFVEGESLRDKLKRERQLTIDEAIDLTRAVASALDYAHRKGVIHRDIKPENILLHDGQPVLADFGIALAATGGSRMTGTGLSLGTPQYMSPEQASGDRELDARSDIYSLGAVLYELLTGEPPHAGASPQAIVARILSEPPTPVERLRASVPQPLSAAISRALSKAPADRFRTAAEFGSAIAAAATTAPTLPQARAYGRRRSRRVSVVLAAVVLTIALFAVQRWILGPGATSDALVRAVAVLPLENVSRDSAQDYFVQGIHDALINELSQISAFERVISRTSVMRFRDSPQSLPEIADALQVDAFVEGSVLRVDNDVRINVRLVRVSPERNLWTNDYENRLEDVLTLQRQVSADIARQIALTLTPGEQARLEGAGSVDPVAYDHYLRGRFHWNRRTEEGFERALHSFNAAIAADSTYAPAYAGLSDTYNLLVQYSHLPLEEGIPLARRAAERAVTIDGELAEAHTSLAEVYFLERRWTEAERAYRRAIALNAAYANAHHFFGWFLSYIGRHDQAIAALVRARELDPLSAIINTDLAAVYFVARRLDQARTHVRRALELEPDFGRALHIQLELQLLEGDTADALATGQQLVDWWAGPLSLARARVAAGRDREARIILDDYLAATDDVALSDPYWSAAVATVYLALGDHDDALTWLEQAVDRRLGAGPYSLMTWPPFDPLRAHPRFQALIERMDFPE